MSKPELDIKLLPEENLDNAPITNENALVIIANSLVGIERHLMALVYLENTRDPEKTQVTYLPDVFHAIYDGSDPFAEVDAAIKKAHESAKTA
jgi:hypothetical protein